MTTPTPPKVTCRLVGEDGNAFAIIGRFIQAARRAGWSRAQIDAVMRDATSGNYDHLLATISAHCENPLTANPGARPAPGQPEATMLTEAYEQGREAAFDGASRFANPYRRDLPAWKQWRQGWLDAREELRGPLRDSYPLGWNDQAGSQD